MRNHIKLVLGAAGFGVLAYLVSRSAKARARIPDINVTTADLDYQNIPYEEVASKNLLDLNLATAAELHELAIDAATAERIIENRPYRSKLELVSRMVVPEALYAQISERVAVAEARDPIKVA